MRLTSIVLLLFTVAALRAADPTPLVDILGAMEERFGLRFIYPNHILVNAVDGSPVALALEHEEYRREELFALLSATVSVAFEPIPDRAKNYLIVPQATLVVRRVQAIEERMAVLESQNETLIRENGELRRHLTALVTETRAIAAALDVREKSDEQRD